MSRRGATQAEIKRGLVFCEYFRSAKEVVKGNGVTAEKLAQMNFNIYAID